MFSKYFKDEKEQTDFFIAIVVIVLAGLLIGYYSFSSEKSFIALESDRISNPKVESLELDGKTFVALETTSSRKQIVKEKVHYSDTEFRQETKILSDSSMVEQTEIVAVGDIPDDEIEEDESENDISDEQEISEDEFDEDFDDDFEDDNAVTEIENVSDADIVNEVDETEIESAVDEIEDSESTTDDEDVEVTSISTDSKSKTTQRGDCIIVIGAFGSERNIKNLIGKLDFKGFPIFKVPYNGLTRVGIYEDCDSVNETLVKIRNTYSPDAFVMKAR